MVISPCDHRQYSCSRICIEFVIWKECGMQAVRKVTCRVGRSVPVERPMSFQPIKLFVSYGSWRFIGRLHIACLRFWSERDEPSQHCHTSCVSERLSSLYIYIYTFLVFSVRDTFLSIFSSSVLNVRCITSIPLGIWMQNVVMRSTICELFWLVVVSRNRSSAILK
jgi:hypothetical protein